MDRGPKGSPVPAPEINSPLPGAGAFSPPSRRPKWFFPVLAALAFVLGVIEVSSALQETQTWDEGIHLSAGYAYWELGDFRWNPEHPPLAKLMSALPLTFLHPDLPVRSAAWGKLEEVQMGREFLYRNHISGDTMLLAGRSMTILLSMLFLAALAIWTRRRFGPWAALLAAVLCAFDPNLIAHGRYVTTDFPVTAFFFLASALWTDYLEWGQFHGLLLAALAFALAMVTKFSAVLLVPSFAVLYAIRWLESPRQFPIRRALIAGAILGGVTALVAAVVYWPATLRALTGDLPPLAKVVDRESLAGWILYRIGLLGNLPAHPLLTGFAKVAAHNASGHASYLLGMRSDQGWWYYFPVVFAVKSTVAALLATAVLIGAGVLAVRTGRKIPFVWFGLLVPPILYFLVSLASAINIGMRHILPVYPFLYVAAAAALARAASRPVVRYAMAALALLQIVECASIYPHYLAFFNALSGGPGQGPRYLVDSNIDWGQDMKNLAQWLQRHGTHSAYIFSFGNAPAPYYGLDAKALPGPLDQRGWDALDGFVVASVTPLNGVYVPLNALAPLRLRNPIAKIGWSMYVYDFRKGAGS
jgi:hypothetical protein